jgi:Ca-activated chloride channel family protein
MRAKLPTFVVGVLMAAAAASIAVEASTNSAQDDQEGFRFRSGVELINVTATVTDADGRFVSGLRKEDFVVYEDGQLQQVSHFSSERVPVSLGIALDTSGSMTPDKMSSARSAIERFIYDLLDPTDELFFMQFAARPDLMQDWTTDRRAISRAVARVNASGGTAMYDAIADALPTTQAGQHQKKALLVISDGNDTSSNTSAKELRQMIRESEVLVYALGVDGRVTTTYIPAPRVPLPIPFPIPGGRRGRFPPVIIGGGGGGTWSRDGERVNADALRNITDETGGRTEIVRSFSDLDGATARLADEFSKQYSLGYPSAGKKDGRWHTIRVEIRDKRYNVRARRGYVAS